MLIFIHQIMMTRNNVFSERDGKDEGCITITAAEEKIEESELKETRMREIGVSKNSEHLHLVFP